MNESLNEHKLLKNHFRLCDQPKEPNVTLTSDLSFITLVFQASLQQQVEQVSSLLEEHQNLPASQLQVRFFVHVGQSG